MLPVLAHTLRLLSSLFVVLSPLSHHQDASEAVKQLKDTNKDEQDAKESSSKLSEEQENVDKVNAQLAETSSALAALESRYRIAAKEGSKTEFMMRKTLEKVRAERLAAQRDAQARQAARSQGEEVSRRLAAEWEVEEKEHKRAMAECKAQMESLWESLGLYEKQLIEKAAQTGLVSS